MGQCTSHNSIVEHGATARMSPTAKTLRAEKNKRRFFRWSFSRKSKKTTNEAQQSQSGNDSSRPAQRGSDGEAKQKSDTQSISKSSVAAVEDVHEDTHGSNDIVPSVDKTEENNNSAHSRVSSLKALEDVSEDVPKAEENSGTYHTSEDIWHSRVSSLKALEDVSEDVPKADENSGTDHTSEDIWHSRMSSLKALEDVSEDVPKAEENSGTDHTSEDIWHSCVSSLKALEDVSEDVPKAEENSGTDHTSEDIRHSRVSSLKALEDVSEDVPKAEENSGTDHTSEDIRHSRVSSLKALEDVSEDVPKAEENSGTDHTSEDIWHSRVSSLKALEDVSEDVPKAEENSGTDHTSEDIWHSCVSSLKALEDVSEDVPKAEENSGTDHTSEDIWHSCVSSLKALEDVSEDVPKAEENSGTDHTSEDIRHSCVSSLKALEDVSEDVPKAEENSGTDHTSEDIRHSYVSSLNISQYVDVPRQEQGSISTNSRTSKSVSSVTEEKNCTPLRSDDVPWENEDEKIHLSLKAKTGNINQHYEVGAMLGKGTFGSVFEATRLSDSRKVALKYVVKKKNMRTVRVGGLLGKSLPAEVALMILMNKGPRVPEIINLLDWYETPREYIMVLERPMPCKDLWHFLLTHGGKISEWQARVVMRQVVTAANICCERGVFHSDIKLQNLLINPNTLQVKLIDFGCGRRLKSSAYSRFGGTEVYMSPEMNKRRYHAKPSTVFSLGILLFKMLFGRFPQELTFKTILENLTEVSKECSELIALCVEMNPSERINLEKILLHDWFQGSIREAARETDE